MEVSSQMATNGKWSEYIRSFFSHTNYWLFAHSSEQMDTKTTYEHIKKQTIGILISFL